MATAISRPAIATEDRVVLPHVSWETYESLLADDEERNVPRLTYDQGVLEMMSPSLRHDQESHKLSLVVEIVAAALGIQIIGVGSTTFRRKDLQRGFEPDAGFYVQNEARMRGRDELDPNVDPPYDVVFEMEVSRSALNKLALFAALGVPEVWRGNRGRVTILLLEGDGYRESLVSRALPVLTADVLTRFLSESRTQLSADWFNAVSAWARAQRPPNLPTP